MSANNQNQGTLRNFKTTSQCGRILKYLQSGNSLTCERARELKFGSNLRSRISDLENAGYKIKREKIKISGGFINLYSLSNELESLENIINSRKVEK